MFSGSSCSTSSLASVSHITLTGAAVVSSLQQKHKARCCQYFTYVRSKARGRSHLPSYPEVKEVTSLTLHTYSCLSGLAQGTDHVLFEQLSIKIGKCDVLSLVSTVPSKSYMVPSKSYTLGTVGTVPRGLRNSKTEIKKIDRDLIETGSVRES